jgi:PAS domain S-box-containing protein
MSQQNDREILQSIIDGEHTLFVRFDLDGYYTFANPAFYRHLQVEPENVIAEHFTKFVHPDDREKARKAGRTCKEVPGRVVTTEFRKPVGRDTDKYIFTRWEMSAVLNNKGEVIEIQGIGNDITDKVVAELQLKENEALYRLLAENSSDIIVLFDQSLKLTYVSPSVKRLLLYNPGEVNNISLFNILHPDDKKLIIKKVQHAFKKKQQLYVLPLRLKNKNGGFEWFEVAANIEYNQKGYHLQTVCNIRSIKERVERQAELKEISERLLLAKNVANLGIGDFNLLSEEYVIDQQVRELFAFTEKEENLVEAFMKRLHSDDLGYFRQKLKEARNNQGNLELTYRIITPKGVLKYIHTIADFSYDKNGKLVRAVTINEDYTERVMAENELKNKNSQLEKINGELDRFVYSVSHDMRAPIASALGLARLISDSDSFSELKQYASLQEKSLMKLDGFISDILTFSRNSRMDVQAAPVKFNDILQKSLEHAALHDGFGSIEIELRIDQKKQFISDAFRLGVIFNNLIGNAIKYQNPSQNNSWLIINISVKGSVATINLLDNGIGIPVDYHDKIFGMFTRATDTKAGSGLGLYIVQETLKRINGTIELTTPADQSRGSSFKVVLNELTQ